MRAPVFLAVVTVLASALAWEVRVPGELPLEWAATPLNWEEVNWGASDMGAGRALADAGGLLALWSALLLGAGAFAAGLAWLSLEGVRASGRRGELRLRRAVGASRGALVREMGTKALHSMGIAMGVGLAVGIFLIPPASLAAGAFTALLLLLGAWAVVQSGEAILGGPLHPRARLAEPFRGELPHPAAPVLQLASATAVLVAALALLHGPGRFVTGVGIDMHPEGERWTLELPPHHRSTMLAAAQEGRVLVSPGFWEGVGTVRYAETECGICFHPGSPPVLAPLKGEPAVHHAVSPDTFEVAGVRLLEGRFFDAGDVSEAEPVAVVTRAFARENFQDGEALGRRVRVGAERGHWHTVVGVVEPRPRANLPSRTQPMEEVYIPIAQHPPSRAELAVFRPGQDEFSALQSAGFTLLSREPAEARAAALDRWVSGYLHLWIGVGVAALALALLGTGLTVGRRLVEEAPELTLRRALGARRWRLVLQSGGFGARVGAVGGLLGSWTALFVVAALVPEALRTPPLLLRWIGPVAVGTTLVTGGVAMAVAGWALRGAVLRSPVR